MVGGQGCQALCRERGVPSVRHSVIHSPLHLLVGVGEHRRSREADSGVEFFDPAAVALTREALHLDAPAVP